MSSQPELFEALSVAGRRFVDETRRSGTALTGTTLTTHLRSAALAYVAQGGGSDVAQTMVDELVPRVTCWCLETYRPPSIKGRNSPSNEALFQHLQPLAHRWATASLAARKGRGAIDRDALRQFLQAEVEAYRSIPGQAHDDDGHEALVARIVGYSGAMNRRAGRKVRAELRDAMARPGATTEARDEAYHAVNAVLSMEAYYAEVDGREAKRFSMAHLHEQVRYETVRGLDGANVRRDTGITLAAVRGAVERINGQPRRQRRIDGLPHTARDLATVLDTETPSKALTVLDTDSLAARLWAPAGNPAARRQQRRRLRLASEAINACPLSLHVKVVGDQTLVGHGVRMPADVVGAIEAAVAAKAVYRLQGGMMARRQGIFGTEVGRDAVAMVRSATVEYGGDDLSLLLKGHGLLDAATTVRNLEYTLGDRFFDGIDVVAGELRAHAVEDDPEFNQHAAGAYILGENGRACRDRAEGPFQAWHTLTRNPVYKARVAGAENSAARHRIRQVAEIFAQVGHVSEIEPVFAAAAAVRPGRKRKPVTAPPRPLVVPRPSKEAQPVPQPKPQAETFRPTYVAPTKLSMGVVEALEAYHRTNIMRPLSVALLATYLDVTADEVRDIWPEIWKLPWHDQVEAAKAGLRRVLKVWAEPRAETLRLLDVDGKGVAREAVMAAGCALRDNPGRLSLAYANDVMRIIYKGCQSATQGSELHPKLLASSEAYGWFKARDAVLGTVKVA